MYREEWRDRKIEDLDGIQGNFEGVVVSHHMPMFRFKALAEGNVTYERNIDGNFKEVTTKIQPVLVRILNESYDLRRYLRIERGTDKIIAIIDRN